MTMMSNPTGMIQGRNLLSSMNLILGATSMVTDVSCVFAGPPDPVNGVTPPLTVDEERRLNCRPISPTVQVLLIIPQVFLERTRSSPAPTYQPVLLLFCPQVLVTARALQSVKKPLPRLLLNPTKPPLKNTILPLPSSAETGNTPQTASPATITTATGHAPMFLLLLQPGMMSPLLVIRRGARPFLRAIS